MHKDQRQEALLKLISAERIASQAELARRLRSRNFDVTQASISRDLEELGVIKSSGIYTVPKKPRGAAVFGVRGLETSGDSLVVVKCDSGLASAAAAALEGEPGVLQTSVADDRTVVCMVAKASALLPRLVTVLDEADIGMTDLRVAEPSLDSVFLHITGTALRD